YSGDTEWVDALVSVADGADLFVVECYGYSGRLTGHVTWEILAPRLPDLRARRIMLTHMNPTMLAHREQAKAAGLLVAEDGLVVDISILKAQSGPRARPPFPAARSGSTCPSAGRPSSAPRHRIGRPRRRPGGWRRSCALHRCRSRDPCASSRPRSRSRICRRP